MTFYINIQSSSFITHSLFFSEDLPSTEKSCDSNGPMEQLQLHFLVYSSFVQTSVVFFFFLKNVIVGSVLLCLDTAVTLAGDGTHLLMSSFLYQGKGKSRRSSLSSQKSSCLHPVLKRKKRRWRRYLHNLMQFQSSFKK